MALGAQIRKLRTARGLTLEQLSEASGVEVGTISALELRDSSRSQYASKIAKAFALTVEQLEEGLFGGEALSDVECTEVARTAATRTTDMEDQTLAYLRALPEKEAARLMLEIRHAFERWQLEQGDTAPDRRRSNGGPQR